MKTFWKKTKKQVTLGVAKVKDAAAGDTRKKEKEDPDFVEYSEKLKAMKAECQKIIHALTQVGREIESLSNSYCSTAAIFSEIITSDCDPYFDYSSKSQEGLKEVNTYVKNFSLYYLKEVQMKPLTDMNAEIDRLKVLRDKRKKNKVFLQQEENLLKNAQNKNKDVNHRVEKTRARREKYERYNSEFITGVSTLYENRNEIYGNAFNIYQFYIAEMIELQEQCLKDQNPDFPFDALKNQIPSCSQKPQLALSSVHGSAHTSAHGSSTNLIQGHVVPNKPNQNDNSIPFNPYSNDDPNILPDTSSDYSI